MRKGYRLQERGEAPGSMVETGGGGETAEGQVRIDFSGGDGNPAGLARAREGLRGRALTAMGEVEVREYQYAGTEAGETQVGG